MRKLKIILSILSIAAALVVAIPSASAAIGNLWQSSVIVSGNATVIHVQESDNEYISVYLDEDLTQPIQRFDVRVLVFEEPISRTVVTGYPDVLYVQNNSTEPVVLVEPCHYAITDSTGKQLGDIGAGMYTKGGDWIADICLFDGSSIIGPGEVVMLRMSVWFADVKGDPTPQGTYAIELPFSVVAGF